MPASHRFDLRARAAVRRNLQTTQFTFAFGYTYPLLGGLFFQSGIFIQALLIPVFFIIRASFEYGADALTAHKFGSDGMPAINFTGVLMHEICLSVMITSIKHPLVFVSLVMSDVLENSFCLWSLSRNTKKSSNRVSPADEEEEKEDGGRDISTCWLGRLPYDPMTVVFAFLFGPQVGYPTGFFKRMKCSVQLQSD